MKKVIRYVGWFLGVVLLIVAGFAAWIQFVPLPVYEVKQLDIKIPTDSASLAQGRNLAVAMCGHCHLGSDGKLSGRLFSRSEDDFGEIWSRNLTHHPVKGLDQYTNGELAWLMRTGVKRDGHMAGYFMSSLQMSDADMGAIIAFLRTNDPLLEASEHDPPAPQYSFLARALVHVGVFKPLPYDEKPVVAPPVTDKVAYGKYMATGRFDCFVCHSASFETNDLAHPEKSPGYMAGGNLVPDENFNNIVSPNITMSPTHGIGAWSLSDFKNAVKGGQRPDQRILSPTMPRFATMTDEEVEAVWAYLQTVPQASGPIAKN